MRSTMFLRPFVIAAMAMICATGNSQTTLLVNLGPEDDAAATAAHFQVADANVDSSAPVTIFSGTTGGVTSGIGTTATVGNLGNVNFGFPLNFSRNGTVGFYAADPILGNYWEAFGGLGVAINVTSISGISVGDNVLVTVYGVGDAIDQDGSISVIYDGVTHGPITTEADGTGASFAQFSFAATSADSIRVENTGGISPISAVNGFSITSTSVSVPEPTTLTVLGLASLLGIVRRRR